MTLSALRLANFKAFGPSQRVPLRPITLLFGANSAGKSSVLHALVLAHQAVGTGDLDTQRTQIGGESIDLGGFRQYVHRRERERQVELAFELDPAQLSGRVAELLRTARTAVVELGIGSGLRSAQQSIFGDAVRELDREGGVRVERFRVEVDGQPMLSMSARGGGILRLDQLDHAHPVFREAFRGILSMATTTQEVREDDLAALAEVLDGLVPGITARRKGLFPRIEDAPDGEQGVVGKDLMTVSRGQRREDLARAAQLYLPHILGGLVDGLSVALEEGIQQLTYLGPLRSYPPRHLAFSQHHDPNRLAGGGYAWDVVRTRADVRERVNQWLGDPERMKTPYELQVRDLLPADALPAELAAKLKVALHNFAGVLLGEMGSAAEADGGGPGIGPDHSEILAAALEAVREDPFEFLGGELAEDMGNVGEVEDLVDTLVDVEQEAEDWANKVVEARSEALQDLVLIDKRSGTSVSHRDVGIGVSQVLPVLVSAFASSEKLLAIEQPEIHLHPALQAELGDVFLESALGGPKNRFLIETHSEHLLLRIMRRMRQTASGELPEGLPAVVPEDVAVLFVEPDGPHSLVREMPLNERGELVKAWPGGFFEEGMRELF